MLQFFVRCAKILQSRKPTWRTKGLSNLLKVQNWYDGLSHKLYKTRF